VTSARRGGQNPTMAKPSWIRAEDGTVITYSTGGFAAEQVS